MNKQTPFDTSSSAFETEGPLHIERAAFDHIEKGARLAIVGITPGAQQRDLASAAYQDSIARGRTHSEAAREAKFAASFGGAMRSNLVRMMDAVGGARFVGLESFAEAFHASIAGKVHFTSAIRNPVFFRGANYNGQVPMMSSPMLRAMIEQLLAEEVKALPNAVWQPLGEKPLAALQHLAALGILDPARIAPPLPHPSGANAERISFFLGRKAEADLSPKTNAVRIQAQRASISAFYVRALGAHA